jgi:hypothetical protein
MLNFFQRLNFHFFEAIQESSIAFLRIATKQFQQNKETNKQKNIYFLSFILMFF